VLLLVLVAIPNFVPARFTSHSGKPIHFNIRVVAPEDGAPVPGAAVQINSAGAVTDADGYCDIVRHFQAHGSVGHSGECSLWGTLRVTAEGFPTWEKELATLFGGSYDYFNKGTQITHVVTLTE